MNIRDKMLTILKLKIEVFSQKEDSIGAAIACIKSN